MCIKFIKLKWCAFMKESWGKMKRKQLIFYPNKGGKFKNFIYFYSYDFFLSH